MTTTIIVSAQFESDSEEFLTAIQTLLDTIGCKVQTIRTENGVALFAIQKQEKDQSAAALEPALAAANVPTGPELEIILPIPVDQTPAIEPMPEFAQARAVASTAEGEVVIKSLSTTCAIPFKFDPVGPSSQLHVSNVQKIGEFISFIYCGLSFKFPVEMQATNICNANPVLTDTSIRVVLSLVNSDINYPVLLNVIESGTGDSSVVFGKDLEEMVTIETTKRTSQ